MTNKIYGIHPVKPDYLIKIRGDAGLYPLWGIDWYNHRVTVYRAGAVESLPFENVAFTLPEKKENEILLYQCVGCEAIYQGKISSCDCTAGEPFVCKEWIAKPVI